MGTTKKPRKKYRPRAVLKNPVGYVVESVTPLQNHDFPLTTLKIKHSQAMLALLQGRAKKYDVDILTSMCNMVEALLEMGFGTQYKYAHEHGKYALIRIASRATVHGRFTPTGEEITMLNKLVELHDAQLEIITVRELEKAVALVESRLRRGKDTVKLPTVSDHLR
jgi:hypothetical protein